ncbi:hypothetical protein BDV38DRAFT_243132 [Aspergillus pseudotamarii]|uniref:Uncharacterized protein n=1 Tax=Aspergillus pseudotamarii TaxID=132259 RepID=A0A5N6SZC1_ASPPS|nr:uncharacterized protein BDV38DRAFT_243132 [Aspergillus pseudotamarii]KAE8139257.1 hypothetical protein BDV38DRAFT_243132 [Aspergillus pseudotamarii]
MIKTCDQDVMALRRDIGNPHISYEELESVKAKTDEHHTILQGLNDVRAENVTLAEDLNAAMEEAAKTNTTSDEWMGKMVRLIQD